MKQYEPHFNYIDICSGENNSPVYHGIFIFHKPKNKIL